MGDGNGSRYNLQARRATVYAITVHRRCKYYIMKLLKVADKEHALARDRVCDLVGEADDEQLTVVAATADEGVTTIICMAGVKPHQRFSMTCYVIM